MKSDYMRQLGLGVQVKNHDTGELELENLVEFWRVDSPRWLKKKWQEDSKVTGSDSLC
jgi:hypothetical protein